MAPKRPSPLENPPAASSSEEESSSEFSSEDEEDEETTQVERPKKSSAIPSSPAVGKKFMQKKPELVAKSLARSSSSDSGSSSESDSDTECGQNVKPIASKPIEETPKAKKPRNKSSASSSKTATEIRDSKRFKKGSEAEAREEIVIKSSDESKKLFQRLWSEEDEIAILNGMKAYSAEMGADMNAFHEFIKKSLHVDVSKAQVIDKIRRLKKKYANNANRGKKGADPTFSNPHELKVFELSKKIWGGGGEETGGAAIAEKPKPSANGTPKKNRIGSTSRPRASLKTELSSPADVPKEIKNLEVERPSWCLHSFSAYDKSLGGAVRVPEGFLKLGLDLIEKSKRIALEEEWKNLHISELELFLRRTALIQDQTKLILEAYKSSEK